MGLLGPPGVDGAQGEQGPQGEQGTQGPQGDQGPAGEDGQDGAPGADGIPTFAFPQPIAPGATCPEGGTEVTLGYDADSNGSLEPSEISGTYTVCNGEDGPTGAAGADGAQGQQGDPGADGQDGTDGANGIDGNSAFISLAPEVVVGGNGSCPDDSIANIIRVGQDLNDDGIFDPVLETTGFVSVCNGADGAEGPEGPQGPAGISNRLIITSSSTRTFSGNQYHERTAECEPGLAGTLLGGGCSVDEVSGNSEDQTITTLSNSPLNSSSDDTWHCKFWNRTSSNRDVTVRAYAICAEVD